MGENPEIISKGYLSLSFAYIHSEKDILKLVTTLIANTKGEGKAGDDFWVKAETLLYCALIGYIHYEAPVEEQNFSTLIEFINAMEVREDDEEFKNPVDLMFDALESEKPNHFAVRQYKKYKLAAGVVCSKRLLNQAVGKSLRTHNLKPKKGAQVMRKNEKITALYERLSRDDFGKDDDQQRESNSISNQKAMLEEFAARQGFTNIVHFTDDGISGTCFDRPGFLAMMKEVEAGNVEYLCIKDMSRMGRDYLKVGQIMEILRQRGVRLIAINDGVDSARGDDDFTPFRNIMNSTYPSRMTRIITGILTPIALRYEDSLYAIYTSFFSTMSVTMPVQIYMLHSDATKMGTRNITCTIAEKLLHSAAIRTQAIAATPIGRSVSRMIMAAPSWEKASTPPMLISIDPEAYTNAAPTEIITSVKH